MAASLSLAFLEHAHGSILGLDQPKPRRFDQPVCAPLRSRQNRLPLRHRCTETFRRAVAVSQPHGRASSGREEYYVQRHCCIERARLERKWLVQIGLLNREQGIDAKRGSTRAPDLESRWAKFHSGTWTPNGGKNEVTGGTVSALDLAAEMSRVPNNAIDRTRS